MDVLCVTCTRTFTAVRASARYCSPPCRQHAYRMRQSVARISVEQIRTCERPDCTMPIFNVDSPLKRFCSDRCRCAAQTERYRQWARAYRVWSIAGRVGPRPEP